MSRNKPFYLSPEDGVTRGPSYMSAMTNAGLISENTFSFSIAPFGQESFMDFGVPNASRMRDASEMQYIDLNDDFYWSANTQGFAIGDTTNSWAWGAIKDADATVNKNEVYSIFDTGASAIIFPTDYFGSFLTEMFNEMGGDEYELSAGYVVTKCYDDFPTIHFLFGEKWIAIDPRDYVVDISDT